MSQLSEIIKEGNEIGDKVFRQTIICKVCGARTRVLNGLTTCYGECFNVWYDEQTAIAQSKKAEYDNAYQQFLSKKR